MANNDAIKRHIVIVGGGTAGWMAANLMAVKWAAFPKVRITLVESEQIGIIGVGEGSTPQLSAFFKSIDVDDKTWMPQCNATYKVGIDFQGWANGKKEDSYFHPFFSDVDDFTRNAFEHAIRCQREGYDCAVSPNHYFLGAFLSAHCRSPIPGPNFPFPVHFGYHFDSHLLGQFLRDLAKSRGVRHVTGTVESIGKHPNGDIKDLRLHDSRQINGDFFVDCSGFKSVLMQETLNVPFLSFASNLLNDRALVIATPAADPLTPQTRSIAMSCGWRWQIPLQNRTGNGYVFSSAHCTDEQAKKELCRSLGLNEEKTQSRVLKIKTGQLSQHWYRNCVAIGLSQSFIEPLEATSLDVVQDTILNFMAAYQTGNFSNQQRQAFNLRVSARIEGIRDYIVAHYVMSQRDDSPYWRDNRAHSNWSPMLTELHARWLNTGDVSELLSKHEIGTYFPEISWQCLFSGYRVFGNKRASASTKSRKVEHIMNVRTKTTEFLRTCALNYKPHADSLLAG